MPAHLCNCIVIIKQLCLKRGRQSVQVVNIYMVSKKADAFHIQISRELSFRING